MTASAPAAEYPLYFRDRTGFVWAIETRGLRLDDKGLTFTSERETRTIGFSEIRSIRLHTAYANAGETPLGFCQIGFRRYRKLTVLSGDSLLRADEGQRAAYHAFVRDLHRRIPPADRARIAFNGGLSDTRYFILCAAMLAAAVLFGLLPLVLIVVAPSWHTLGVAAASWVWLMRAGRAGAATGPAPMRRIAFPMSCCPNGTHGSSLQRGGILVIRTKQEQ